MRIAEVSTHRIKVVVKQLGQTDHHIKCYGLQNTHHLHILPCKVKSLYDNHASFSKTI